MHFFFHVQVGVKLDKYMENKIFRGVRNILEGEPDDWLGREAVHRGLGIIIIYIIIIIIIIIITIIILQFVYICLLDPEPNHGSELVLEECLFNLYR